MERVREKQIKRERERQRDRERETEREGKRECVEYFVNIGDCISFVIYTNPSESDQ